LIPKEKEAVIVYKDSMIQMYQERAKLDAMSRGFKTVSYLKKIEERKIEEKNVIVLLWRPPIS
jgi:heme-degrading monooxygenase HmoA